MPQAKSDAKTKATNERSSSSRVDWCTFDLILMKFYFFGFHAYNAYIGGIVSMLHSIFVRASNDFVKCFDKL